jgi:hypothetical protein
MFEKSTVVSRSPFSQYCSVKVFFDENYKEEDAINRRLYNNHCFVLTAIYRVSYPNRTVLPPFPLFKRDLGGSKTFDT